MTRRPLLTDEAPIRRVDAQSAKDCQPGAVLATDDHDVIREWAARRAAEPATGEETASGPATIDVHDDGTGIRFNFPGVARFRPISWHEWFLNFTRYDLIFIFENDTPGEPPSARYRLLTKEKLREYQIPI
jgi:hypothetical protein